MSRRWVPLAVATIAIEILYLYLVTAGTWTNWPTYHNFLDDQAEGFRAGHLYMAPKPSPQLLAKANPFDPANVSLWYWDASLHNGHYYLYWGPVPAVLLTLAKVLFRISSKVGDQYPVFGLVTLQLVAGALLVDRMWRRLFPQVPVVLAVCALVVLALANPTPFILARGGVYEAAIVGGHAFLLLGFVFAFDAVWSSGETERPARHLGAAGTAWALALACRISLAPAIAGVALLTLAFVSSVRPLRWRYLARQTIRLAVPLFLGSAALLAFNKARFGAWLSFGQGYQMSWIVFSKSVSFIPVGLYAYALRPFLASCRFPFVFAADMGAATFPAWMKVPVGYSTGEPQVGFLRAVPWTWFVPLAIGILAHDLWAARRNSRTWDNRERAGFWVMLALLAALAGTFGVLIPIYTTTMRYLGDTIGPLVLVGTAGVWGSFVMLARWRRLQRVWLAVTLLAGLATVALGLAFGFRGYYSHFERFNPALSAKLIQRFSVCHDPKALLPEVF